jgi:hypothetical protein
VKTSNLTTSSHFTDDRYKLNIWMFWQTTTQLSFAYRTRRSAVGGKPDAVFEECVTCFFRIAEPSIYSLLSHASFLALRFLTMKTMTNCSSDNAVEFQNTARHVIPEDRDLLDHLRTTSRVLHTMAPKPAGAPCGRDTRAAVSADVSGNTKSSRLSRQ